MTKQCRQCKNASLLERICLVTFLSGLEVGVRDMISRLGGLLGL
jgi:hypothetical protein